MFASNGLITPLQSILTYLCAVRPPASGLARFPLTMTKYLDYHHVYSYVVAPKNFFLFVPCNNSGHTLAHNTDNACHGFCFCSYSQDKLVMRAKPGHAHLHSIKFLYHDKFPAPRQISPRHCASAHLQTFCNQDNFLATYQNCTATLVMLNKICTRMAKTAPYPPCLTGAARQACTVTTSRLKYQDQWPDLI